MIISGEMLLVIMLYALVGLLRTIFKTVRLAHEGKIGARNDDVAAFKYMMKHPTVGDIIFLPVHLGFMLACFVALTTLKLFFALLK